MHVTAVDVNSASHADVPTSPQFSDVVKGYVALTKPRIIELLLLTTVPVMFLAEQGVPSLWLVLATFVGGALSAGSANALNCVVDADVDQLMRRTSRRPLARHQIPTRNALIFGLVLGVVSTAMLGFWVNWLSAGLALAANVFYVVGYTMILKRRTTQNIVWGGAAGCFPAVIGWTAVTNELALAPFVLFLVIFFWTPPHFWSLAMRYREDYSAASIPMLPSVVGSAEVARQIVIYTWVMVGTSLLLWPLATGWFYPAVAIVLGIVFIVEAYDLKSRAQDTEELSVIKPMRLFHYSNAYLALLFVAAAIDPFLR
ncbi:protoheme IX farnesyltransferase [Aeromicrobium sp. SMF47]|uniref:Protoheme IX farnesyltransferase n=1 Tax=Aeromicrobium yanjiei TaxID=2662028 RepID=A0A5Q2MHR3_9ACTN|nr:MULTISPECIES: heme o synthase [Aeromicrobium]MRJ77601.1 protoheme IX farnesyltransferase [Aeromicrobium yanjiei]MRK01969.1 protoheme IX farnesyltransferase [Aeromicrobium sp. S22]QGG41301.1 protoheme IX farnesyltransferase [Aeromicrobium yanjiei]